MEELDLSLSILSDIIDNDVPFAEALKKVFKGDQAKQPYRNVVAALVGCELRHHLLFEYLTNPLEGLDTEEKRYLALVLGDIHFVKYIDAEIVKAALRDRFGAEKYAIAEPLLNKVNEKEPLIPDSIPRTSNHYLSLRYNTPEWVLKIWQSFGYGTTYKMLRKNALPVCAWLRVCEPLKADELIASGNDFVATAAPDILSYRGKTPVRKLADFQKGRLFAEKPGIKLLIDKYTIDEPKELLVYQGNDDPSLLYEVIEHYGDRIGINLGVPAIEPFVGVSKRIRAKGLKNVNFFAAPVDSMQAAISRPQDLVIASPKSTNFDRIREQPDFLLHFHKESGEKDLYEQEKSVLENAASYVAENGTLLYLIMTVSKKEGRSTINAFLANHPEFHLIEEKQCFPHEPAETAMYFAAMVKKDVVAKDPETIAPLLTDPKPAPSPSLSAEGK